MRILNKLKNKTVKFAILGMTAFAAMGTTTTCIPSYVSAAEKTPTTYEMTGNDIIPKGELQKIIDDAKLCGTLMRCSDNSFVLMDGNATVECTYKDAGSTYLHDYDQWCSNSINNAFFSKLSAENFIKDMDMTETTITQEKIGSCYEFVVRGKLPLVKINYRISSFSKISTQNIVFEH